MGAAGVASRSIGLGVSSHLRPDLAVCVNARPGGARLVVRWGDEAPRLDVALVGARVAFTRTANALTVTLERADGSTDSATHERARIVPAAILKLRTAVVERQGLDLVLKLLELVVDLSALGQEGHRGDACDANHGCVGSESAATQRGLPLLEGRQHTVDGNQKAVLGGLPPTPGVVWLTCLSWLQVSGCLSC